MPDRPHPAIASRLKRASHLDAIIEMIENRKPCAQIAEQLQSIEIAIRGNTDMVSTGPKRRLGRIQSSS
jgi:DNA-binding FrmR family transcriptional regulator